MCNVRKAGNGMDKNRGAQMFSEVRKEKSVIEYFGIFAIDDFRVGDEDSFLLILTRPDGKGLKTWKNTLSNP